MKTEFKIVSSFEVSKDWKFISIVPFDIHFEKTNFGFSFWFTILFVTFLWEK